MRNSLYLFAFIFVFASFTFVQKTQTSNTEAKVLAVAFHADWCGGCKKLGKKMQSLKPNLTGKSVEFVKFNFTDDETKAQNKEIAKKHGIEDILANNNGTGYIILLDADSKKELARVNGKMKEDKILATFEKYLK